MAAAWGCSLPTMHHRASLTDRAWLGYLALAGASLVAYLLLPQGGPRAALGAEASAGVGGTGLGLALSKALVEGMGGTIAVESAVERGSTFRVVFHAADDPTAAA